MCRVLPVIKTNTQFYVVFTSDPNFSESEDEGDDTRSITSESTVGSGSPERLRKDDDSESHDGVVLREKDVESRSPNDSLRSEASGGNLEGTLTLSPLQTALVQSKTMNRIALCSYSVLKGCNVYVTRRVWMRDRPILSHIQWSLTYPDTSVL